MSEYLRVADLPRAYVDFNFLGTLKAPRGRLELFTRLPRGGVEELQGQGIEPSDGLRVTLYDLDAEDGTPTYLEADGELFWDDDRGEWLAAFEKGGFRTVPRAD